MNSGGSESISASPYKDGGYDERQFNPMSAPKFVDAYVEEDIEWVFEDYLPSGGVVVLAAKPKVGKTTLAYQLAVKIAKGEMFLERSTMQGGVLILALEEHPRDVKLRLEKLGGTVENLYVHTGSLTPNEENFAAIERFVKERGVKLILVDTLAMFWRLDDESDASKMTRAMKPLITLARRTNAAVLLIHHHRKASAEGNDGDEIRGSIALQASVDVTVSMTRPNGNVRLLKSRGRYADTPEQLSVELRDGEYFVIDGDAETVAQEKERLTSALTAEPQSLDDLAVRAKVQKKRAYGRIKELVSEGRARIHGKGVRGAPYLYSAVVDDSLSSVPSSLEEEVKEQVEEPSAA